MDRSFWLDRWRRNEIGFHMDESHEYLRRFFHRLHVGPEWVFVPLCGKSPDLLWLHRQGARVLGVELSDIAVRDFFDENGLAAESEPAGRFRRYHSPEVTLLRGDLFDLEERHLDQVRGVYDRGSLVALPSDMRRDYVAHLCRILPADSRILLISYDYDQARVPGPPFSVPEDEIGELFSPDFSLEVLDRQDALPTHHILRQRGLDRLTEFACLLTHR